MNFSQKIKESKIPYFIAEIGIKSYYQMWCMGTLNQAAVC